jgi:hypothetical protein
MKVKSTHKPKATERQQREDAKQYELLTAVFEVTNVVEYEGKPQTLCVMRYVRLDGGLSRDAVISLLRSEIRERYKMATFIRFAFWCDGYTANGGSPMVFIPTESGCKRL